MTDIILNERTAKKISNMQGDLPHALLLSGEKGVGLSTIAKNLAGSKVAAFIEPLDSKGTISHDTGTISVEVIRTLYDQTRAKTASRRVIIIDDADRMSLGAQAAFLKLLEEPSENTHFILSSHNPQAILPTVKSRTQTLRVEPINDTQTNELLDALKVVDGQTRTQLQYLAGGLPAELQRLVSDKEYFMSRAEITGDTRTFLTGSTYDKLLVVHKYHQDRAKSLQLIDSALMVSRRSLQANPLPNVVGQLEKLLHTREKIEGNCNIRLQLATAIL